MTYEDYKNFLEKSISKVDEISMKVENGSIGRIDVASLMLKAINTEISLRRELLNADASNVFMENMINNLKYFKQFSQNLSEDDRAKLHSAIINLEQSSPNLSEADTGNETSSASESHKKNSAKKR